MQPDSGRDRIEPESARGIREGNRGSRAIGFRILIPIVIAATGVACQDTPASRIGKVLSWAREGGPKQIAHIQESLDDPNGDVRIAALQALAGLKDPSAEPAATRALRDGDPTVRATAVGCLAQLQARTHVEEISELLSSDADAGVRRRCASALNDLGGDGGIEALTASLRDPDRDVRLLAVRAIAHLDPIAGFDPLAGVVLEDADWEVRAEAARLLGDTQRAEAAPALDAALGDPNEFVRAAASAARKKLAIPAR